MGRLEHRLRTRAAPAFLLAAAAVAAMSAAHAADGTIYFTGEIVAAPYTVSAAPATMGTRTGKAGTASELIFQRQYIDRPSANVRIDTRGGQPLELAFVDAQGQHHTLNPKSAHAIGQDGGTLSIRDAAMRTTAALVTVSYN